MQNCNFSDTEIEIDRIIDDALAREVTKGSSIGRLCVIASVIGLGCEFESDIPVDEDDDVTGN